MAYDIPTRYPRNRADKNVWKKNKNNNNSEKET